MKKGAELLLEFVDEEIDKMLESANTKAADINEMLLGYYCGGGSWDIYGDQSSEVLTAFEKRKGEITPEQYEDQDGRAIEMAKASLSWASSNGYDGSPIQAWWTARPGVLSRATGVDVLSRKNPTDVLLKFGKDSYLGLSAKSTKGAGDIGFKNPGIGRLGKQLGLDMKSIAEKPMKKNLEKLDFGGATTTSGRKQYLKGIGTSRTNPKTQHYYDAGAEVLMALRDSLLNFYLDMDIDDLKEHFLEEWIDAGDVFPYYIKVTGHGTGGKYSATVSDPIENEKVKKISSEHIELEPVGKNSIVVWAGTGTDASKLFRIRFKWESMPLASSIKMSGDPA